MTLQVEGYEGTSTPYQVGSHRHCGSGDIILVCHMILNNHMVKESCEFMEPIKVSHHPAKFGDDKNCCSGDKLLLICHVILQDHLIEGSC